MEECNSMCCRKGYIQLTDKELKLITGDKIINLSEIEIISPGTNRFCLNNACPSLLNKKCIIHINRNRPLICKEFPLFIDNNRIIVSHDCPAVEDNRLYPFLKKFKKMGFEIV